jgi:hypothetical protein
LLAVDCDHPAVRGAVIAFIPKRNSEVIGIRG